MKTIPYITPTALRFASAWTAVALLLCASAGRAQDAGGGTTHEGETGATLKAADGSDLPEMGPIYFEFGLEDLTAESRGNLDALAEKLVSNPELKVTIEGHADERGSSEFNIALGERRAEGARKYLIAKGAKEDQVRTISYGEERPVDERQNEEAWAKNRRDQFRMGGRLSPQDAGQGDGNGDADANKNKDDADKNKNNGQDDANKNGQGDGNNTDNDGTLFGQSYLFWGGVALTTVGVVGAVAGAAGAGVGGYIYANPGAVNVDPQYGLYAAIGFGVLAVVGVVAAAAGGGIIAYDLLSE